MAEKMAMKIVVDDGSVRVPIENTLGQEIGSFCFRPTDTEMYGRYKAAMEHLEEVVEPIKKAQINADGTADDSIDGSYEAVQEAQKRLYELCDNIFNGNFSEAFFGKMAPFSPIGGRFYFEIALENLGAFIRQQFEEEAKRAEKRVGKYTKKYERGEKK